MVTDNKVKVRGVGRTETEPLNCIDPDSFYVNWEINSAWSIQFTAHDDKSFAYSMLDAQASLFFDGQEYIIKQAEPSASGKVNTIDVVAAHVFFELSRIRKYKTYIDPADADKQTDVKVYGSTQQDDDSSGGDDSGSDDQIEYHIEDVLKYWLDGNQLGFSYQVIGDFTTAQLEELADGSGTDMLSKITEAWPNAVIYPDNRNIRVYAQDQFYKDYGNRLDYEYNTTEFKWTYDSTSLTNEIMCIGGKCSIESESSSSTSSEYYYFAPFIYRDEESINKYGEYPADPFEDGRFSNKNAMIEAAKAKIQPQPALSAEVTAYSHFKPIAGDMIHIMVKEQSICTNEAVVGFNWYPYSSANPTSVTLNSNGQNILDYQNSRQVELSNAIDTVKKDAQESIEAVNQVNQVGGDKQLFTWLKEYAG